MAKHQNQIEAQAVAAQKARRESRHRVIVCPSRHMEAGKLLGIVKDLEWYAIRTAPQKEFVVQEIMTRKGIATYCPADSRWRKVSRYVKAKEMKDFPLMVGYVFAGFVPGVPMWFNLFAIHAVQGVIGINGRPIRIPSKAMETIVRRYRNGLKRPDEEQFMRTYLEFKKGDLVRIADGPFEGVEVPVVEIDGRNATVLIEMLGSTRELPIDMGLLEYAAA